MSEEMKQKARKFYEQHYGEPICPDNETWAEYAAEFAAQERNAELQAALQAKEQELAQLRLGLAADLLKVTDAAKLSVAQARQQAIAECMKIARSPYSDEVGCRAGDDPADVGAKISEGIRRSLTPPPALTHPFCDDCGHEEHSHGSRHVPCIVINCPCKGWKVAPALTKEK